MALTFDATYYYKNRPDVLEAFLKSGTTLSAFEFALSHYNNHGWKEGANPSAVFNTAEYLNANPDVKAAGVNPFDHLNQHGLAEGRAPSLEYPSINEFDWQTYLNSNPDLKAAGITTAEAAYTHYINHGYAENRPGSPDLTQFKLQKALNSYQTSKAALDDFLEEAGMDAEAIECDLREAEEALEAHLEKGSIAELEATIALKKAAVSAREVNLTAVLEDEEELAATVKALQAKQATYKEVVKAGNDAAKALTDAVTKVATDANLTLKLAFAEKAENIAALKAGEPFFQLITEDGLKDAIVMGQNGKLAFGFTIDAETATKLQPVLEAAQKGYDASQTWANAQNEFEALILKVLGNDELDSVDHSYIDWKTGEFEDKFFGEIVNTELANALEALAAAQSDLATAQNDLGVRQDLVAKLAAAQALFEQLEALQEAVESAAEAIRDLGYNLPEELDATFSATSDGDILIYRDDAAKDGDSDSLITNFGVSGDDMIVFGKEFKLVKLADDFDVTKGKFGGDLSSFEIFYKQVNDGTILYVEDDTWDGSASGDWKGNEIKLVGVDASSITFENGILRVAGSEIA